jgi:hypothetical protein
VGWGLGVGGGDGLGGAVLGDRGWADGVGEETGVEGGSKGGGDWAKTGGAGGSENGSIGILATARLMYLAQIAAGKEPPVTPA